MKFERLWPKAMFFNMEPVCHLEFKNSNFGYWILIIVLVYLSM